MCKDCPNFRNQITTTRQLKDHDKNKHMQKNSNVTKGHTNVQGNPAIQHSPRLELAVAPIAVTPEKLRIFQRKQSSDYFMHECQESGLGGALLVGKSQFNLCNNPQEIEKDEVLCHIKLANFSLGLTADQRKEFGEVLHGITEIQKKQLQRDFDRVSRNWPTKPPHTEAEFRSKNTEGLNAIVPNLPHPQVEQLSSHACVSLKECIADLLGHGLEVETISSNPTEGQVQFPSESPRAFEIQKNSELRFGKDLNVVTLMITEWSDDFDPLTVKRNLWSIWVKTVTISHPRHKNDSPENTYLIAVGPKSSNHEEVESKFAAELKELSSGESDLFYCKRSKRMVKVHAELFVSLGDQPERRAANFIMRGNSTYGPRFGYSCPIGSLVNVIPSCESCLQKNISAPKNAECLLESEKACANCVNWDIMCKSDLLAFDPPQGCPASEVPPNGKLRPFQVTCQTLKDSLEKGFEKMRNGDWTKEQTKMFFFCQLHQP